MSRCHKNWSVLETKLLESPPYKSNGRKGECFNLSLPNWRNGNGGEKLNKNSITFEMFQNGIVSYLFMSGYLVCGAPVNAMSRVMSA
jgi:hypothetical protein